MSAPLTPHRRRQERAALLALGASLALACSCEPAGGGGRVSVALPSAVSALSVEDAKALVATLEIPGLLAETALVVNAEGTEASGSFTVDVDPDGGAVEHPFVIRLRFAPPERAGRGAGADGSSALLGVLEGNVLVTPRAANALEPDASGFDTCGAVPGDPAGACAAIFDVNRNGLSNLEDLALQLDPFPAPAFVDVAPDDLPFPSGIRLGSFARQVVVVENVTARPISVTATLVDAPGVTMSLYETTFNPANSAQRALDLGALAPFQEVLIAVSFAPVNPFLTVGDIFIEATDAGADGVTAPGGAAGVSGVRQGQRIRILANADGELQPPPPDFTVAPIASGADLLGFPTGSVETFSSFSLFNGLAVTAVTPPDGGGGSTPGLPFSGRTLSATFTGDDGAVAEATVPADAAFLVEIPAGHKLSVSLSGLAAGSDVDLAFFVLDGADSIVAADASRNRRVGKAGNSVEALEHRNDSAANERALVVLGRVEAVVAAELAAFIEGRTAAGALSLDIPAQFALSAHATSAPEFTRPPSPISGPIEGGNRVELFGRGFHPLATVTFADGVALDCDASPVGDGGADGESVVDCAAPPGSLLVGKNPATIVVANPGRDDGGDGQAATLPEGYAYAPPAPRLDAIVPNVAARGAGSSEPVTLEGAFFSVRNGAPEVRFGDLIVPAGDVQLLDTTRLRVVPPDAAVAGVVAVSVRNVLDPEPGDPEGFVRFSLASNVRNFTYVDPTLPAPTLVSVDPTRVPIDGGDGLVLNGTGFQAGATVIVDGSGADDVAVLSAVSATAAVPARDAPAFVDVEIVNPDGQRATLAGALEYFVPNPRVDGVFPDQAAVSGGTFVIVDGAGFRAGVTVEFVDADGAALASLNVNRVSSTTLLAATPAVPAAGEYTLRVRNLDGQSDDFDSPFQFLAPQGPPPRVDAISPAVGDKDVPPLVTLRGAEFRSPAVLVGSSSVTVVDFVDGAGADDSVTFFPPPAAAPGPVVVRLINSDGQADTAVFNYFTTLGAPPVIDGVTPGSARAGETLTLLGRNFDAPVVVVGGQVVAPLSVTGGRIDVAVPNLDAVVDDGAVVAIELTNGDGQSTSAAFVYEEPSTLVSPVITSLEPAVAGVGNVVVVNGSGFGQLSFVSVGDASVAPAGVSATSFSFTVPANAAPALPATVVVRVGNADGGVAESALGIVAFDFDEPRIDNCVPAAGPPTGGTSVTLSGANFVAAGAELRVAGIVVTPTSVTPTQVTFLTPAVPNDAFVIVTWTNADGRFASTEFEYDTPLVINGDPAVGFISPEVVHALVPGDEITVVGANLDVIDSAAVDRVADGASFAATISAQTSVSVTVSLDEALEDSVDVASPYVVRLSHAGGNLASLPFDARKPRVTLSLEQGANEIVFLGEFFNPARLQGDGTLDNGFGSVIGVNVLTSAEGFVSTRILAPPVPGSLYELALDYVAPEGGTVGVAVGQAGVAGAGIAFQAPSLAATTVNRFLPSDSSLAGVSVEVQAAGLSNPAFGTPSTFELFDVGGAVVGGGTWTQNGFDTAELTFSSTTPLPAGGYGVRLATSTSPAIAELADAFVLERRATLSVAPVVPFLAGQQLIGDGLFLAGDVVVAERQGTGEVRVLGATLDGAVRTADGFGDSDGFFDIPSTPGLFAGIWKVCVVGPNDPVTCAPPALPATIFVEDSTCATPTLVGAGDVVVVPLQQRLPVFACGDFDNLHGHLLQITTAVPAEIQSRARLDPANADVRMIVGQNLCGPSSVFQCISDESALSSVFVEPGTYDLFVYDRDPASLGGVLATVQLTALDGISGACLTGNGDGDGATVCQFDCDDGDPLVSPAALDDTCNDTDDNCDGRVDNLGGACAVGGQNGICNDGERGCAGVDQETCDQVVFANDFQERCTTGADEDCDGEIDEVDCIASFFQCPAGSLTFEASGQGLPLFLPDAPAIVSSPAVIGDTRPVTKVAVRIENLQHTFDGDLVLSLIAPTGQRVALSQRRGGGGENFINTIWDDACSATPIFNGSPPFTGCFGAEVPLSAFNGIAANGTWRLESADNAGADVGTLNSWTLGVCTQVAPPLGNTSIFHLDSNFANACGGPAPLTVDNVTIDNVNFNVGTGSARFDGLLDEFTQQAGSAVQFGGGDFTVDHWFFPTNGADNNVMVQVGSDRGNRWLTQLIGGQVRFVVIEGTNITLLLESAATFADNQWYHYAVTRAGDVFTLYVDGAVVASQTIALAMPPDDGRLTVGSDEHFVGGTSGFFGNIDEVRVTKGTALFSGPFTPSTTPNVCP